VLRPFSGLPPYRIERETFRRAGGGGTVQWAPVARCADSARSMVADNGCAVLYIATLASARCNPVRRPFYQGLRATGKQAKVALVAAMRKLLRIVNAMLKTKPAWSSPCPSPSRTELPTGGILQKIRRRPTLWTTLNLILQCGRFLLSWARFPNTGCC
jgi:hypothetical protein